MACTVKAEVATGSTVEAFKTAICDRLSQQESANIPVLHSNKCCSADNYRVIVSMYFDEAVCTPHLRAKQLPSTIDNGFVIFQSPCR
jgi:hypothetical protein